MQQRAARASVSDANWDVYVQRRDAFESPDELSTSQRISVQSPIDEDELVIQVYEALVQNC